MSVSQRAAPLVALQGAAFGYAGRPVVRADSLSLHPARCLGIFGPNGAGKTTLLRGITSQLPPLSGLVHLPNPLRFGYLPQHRAMDHHWPMTALDAASLATSATTPLGWVASARAAILQSMRQMNVHDLAPRRFAKLSGGQQQRVLLAGALATSPDVLLLDEPTDGLDTKSRAALLDVLQRQLQTGLCTVMVSHDVEDLLLLATDVAWLHPPSDEDHPSLIEVIVPQELARRVTASGVKP